MVKKVKNFVEVSSGGTYMWLPANANGYKIFLYNGGSKEHKDLFIKRKVVIRASRKNQ